MDKLLTVSIAAFNSEQYIRRTLDSLVDSNLKEKLEVFVIDDGGTDATLAIAQEYETKYPNIIVPVHKANGGYGSTVNYSIAHAHGKFFKLLDGDDWFITDELTKFIEVLAFCESDIIVTNYYKGAEIPGNKEVRVMDEFVNKSLPVEQAPQIGYGMWALAYRTDFLRQCNIELPEHMLYTDAIYAILPFAKAKTISFYDYYVYFYRVGRPGQSVSKNSRLKHQDDMLFVCRMIIDYCAREISNGNINSDYLIYRSATKQRHAVKTVLLNTINRSNFKLLKEVEKNTLDVSKKIYNETVADCSIFSKFIGMMRKTNYALYWVLALIPNRFSNWE